MSSSRQSQTTAVVTGAGRGFGSAIAAALIDHGHQVVGVARTADALADVHRRLGAAFVPVVADATDAVTARALIEQPNRCARHETPAGALGRHQPRT